MGWTLEGEGAVAEVEGHSGVGDEIDGVVAALSRLYVTARYTARYRPWPAIRTPPPPARNGPDNKGHSPLPVSPCPASL